MLDGASDSRASTSEGRPRDDYAYGRLVDGVGSGVGIPFTPIDSPLRSASSCSWLSLPRLDSVRDHTSSLTGTDSVSPPTALKEKVRMVPFLVADSADLIEYTTGGIVRPEPRPAPLQGPYAAAVQEQIDVPQPSAGSPGPKHRRCPRTPPVPTSLTSVATTPKRPTARSVCATS